MEEINDIPAPQTTETTEVESIEETVTEIVEEKPVQEKAARPQTPVTQEMQDQASRTLATMLDYLKLEATVRSEGKPGKINLLVASEDAGRIIGRKGQSLESLQLLVNRMMQKEDIDFPKVYIDIDGYSSKRPEGRSRREPRDGDSDGAPRRERSNRRDRGERGDREHGDDRPRRGHRSDDSDSGHDEVLRQQALDAAKEVRRWGESVSLPAMNAHDRRIIHITLEEQSDLQTESEGEGSRKSIVISLKK